MGGASPEFLCITYKCSEGLCGLDTSPYPSGNAWTVLPPSFNIPDPGFQPRTSFSLKPRLTANSKHEHPELPSGQAQAVFLGSFLHEAVCLNPK